MSDAAMSATVDEDAEILREYARYDWLYTTPRYRVLHAPKAATYDGDEWCARDVTFECGFTVERAWIPGVFSRMGLPRCSRCCDALGFPRGVGSPKNDDGCRVLLGLPVRATGAVLGHDGKRGTTE